MIVGLEGGSQDPASHGAATPVYKVSARFENLSLTVTDGNGMFQFVNQSRLKLLHLWCSTGWPVARSALSRFKIPRRWGRSLRRFQASAAAQSRRSTLQVSLLVSAAAALALAWYTSPEKVAGYLADRLPHLFVTTGPAPQQQPAHPKSTPPATSELAQSAPTTASAPLRPVAVSVAEREPPVLVAALAPATPEPAAEPASPLT